MFKREKPPLLKTIRDYNRKQTSKWRKFKKFLKFNAIIIFFVILFFHIKIDLRKQHMMVYKAEIFVKNKINNLFNNPNTSSHASLLNFEPVGTTSELKPLNPDQPVSSIQINTVGYRKKGNKTFIRLTNKDSNPIDYNTMIMLKIEIHKDQYKRLPEDKKDVFIDGLLKSIQIKRDP